MHETPTTPHPTLPYVVTHSIISMSNSNACVKLDLMGMCTCSYPTITSLFQIHIIHWLIMPKNTYILKLWEWSERAYKNIIYAFGRPGRSNTGTNRTAPKMSIHTDCNAMFVCFVHSNFYTTPDTVIETGRKKEYFWEQRCQLHPRSFFFSHFVINSNNERTGKKQIQSTSQRYEHGNVILFRLGMLQ